ncbi:MAG: shikimate dehydrogenase family protein [Candidatus Binatia bacterium]
MANTKDIAAIQACLTNRLDSESIGDGRITGVIGAAPSRYSKSPSLWNAAFGLLGMNAAYLLFDIEKSRLGEFIAVLRSVESVMGINITVPYKLAIMDYLDELDPGAERVQAVNTVVRTQHGRLVGYNTDGAGFVDSILTPHPGQAESFVESLAGSDVLLLGAGGSARAVAFHLSELLNRGKLVICNRTLEHARALAEELRAGGFRSFAISEEELPQWAPQMKLIINSTTKGQGGIFWLERYSALAPALVSEAGASLPAAKIDITKNNEASLALASAIPEAVRFYDLIYHPEETVFLRHGRATGHKTMNGKAMIVCQAALAFFHHICKEELHARELDQPETLARLVEVMYQAW